MVYSTGFNKKGIIYFSLLMCLRYIYHTTMKLVIIYCVLVSELKYKILTAYGFYTNLAIVK